MDYLTDKIKTTIWPSEKQRRILVILFCVIFLMGIILRTIGYSDLLIFKSDQARDALLMERVIAGHESMPLLGASIGGEEFYLGPISYYFQYIGAIIFGSSPEAFALPDLVFGILTIPLFYLLTRKFFTQSISLWLTAIVSVSPLFVTFSRFAWNPNSVPFFSIFAILSILAAVDKKHKKRIFFLITSAASLGVVAQLHLLAFLGLSSGIMLYLLFYRSLRVWEVFLCFGVFLLINTPMIIHEVRTGGKNTQGVIGITETSNVRSDEKKLYEKVFRAYQENARGMWLTATGLQNTDIVGTNGRKLKCDKKCKQALPTTIISLVLLGCVIYTFLLVWQKKYIKSQKEKIALIGFWLVGFALCTILLAYDLTLRYFIAIAPAYLIMLGYCGSLVLGSKNVFVRGIGVIIGICIVFIQFATTSLYLYELHASQFSSGESQRDLRFGTESKVTLGQLRMIGHKSEENLINQAPVIIVGETKYLKALHYVIKEEYGFRSCYYRGPREELNNQQNIIEIQYLTKKNDKKDQDFIRFGTLQAKFTPAYNVVESTDFPKGCVQE